VIVTVPGVRQVRYTDSPGGHWSFAAALPAAVPFLAAGQGKRAALEDLGEAPGCSGETSLVPVHTFHPDG
jgi:hypothetical protein